MGFESSVLGSRLRWLGLFLPALRCSTASLLGVGLGSRLLRQLHKAHKVLTRALYTVSFVPGAGKRQRSGRSLQAGCNLEAGGRRC